MYQRLSANEKLAIIKRAKAGEKISKLCREAKISRTILYKWIKELEKAAPRSKKTVLKAKNPKGRIHWKSLALKKQKQILKLAIKNPQFSPKIISKTAGVSVHAVWNVLKRNNLNTKKDREDYVYRNGKSLIVERKITDKRTAIRRFENGEKVTAICQDFGISRTIFYRWLKRYKKAGEDALLSLRPKEEKHWRFVPGAQELVIEVVISHPEYTPLKISRKLKILGSHGVYNILKRLNLNTYQRRLVYAKSQGLGSIPSFGEGEKEVSVFGKLPSISAIPPPFWQRIFSLRNFLILLPVFFFSLFLILAFKNIFHAGSLNSSIGMAFSFLALTLGMFFFVYSLKYYITIAMVLSFSRQGKEGGEDLPAGRQGSFLAKLFGVSISVEPKNGSSAKQNSYQRARLDFAEASAEARRGGGLQADLSKVILERKPFVSIHLATYNEKRVIDRLLTAATSQHYDNYEVVIVDDSNDETRDILKKWENHPRVKVIKRETREGFKGAALKKALENTDKRAEFVIVFDADFIPYPDTIVQFLKYFQSVAGGLDLRGQTQNYTKRNTEQHGSQLGSANVQLGSANSRIAAIQGYQWHVLNKSENWVTRGVRTEYAGSYVIERSATEIYGGLKQIAGSVYMIRRDVLQEIGWGTSITEDFQLTLKLYAKGYKVVYTPYIQAPAEAVSTVKRMIRQRMRWAEGHSFNVKRMFVELLFGRYVIQPSSSSTPQAQNHSEPRTQNYAEKLSLVQRIVLRGSVKEGTFVPSPLTRAEKLEVLYLTPYYLQALLFMAGTFFWFMAEAVFKVSLPFWAEVWGWSLVLTNMLALPLMNLVGLFLEESEEKDYMGLLSFFVTTYMVAPFSGYAALKGFIEKEEGPWFRTPKTGRITDVFTPGRFYRKIFGWLRPQGANANAMRIEIMRMNANARMVNSPYLALATANNHFSNFKIRPKKAKWIGRITLVIFLLITTNLFYFSRFVPKVEAATDTLYFDSTTSARNASAMQMITTTPANAENTTPNVTPSRNEEARWRQWLPTGGGSSLNSAPTVLNATGWILDTSKSADTYDTGNWTFNVRTGGTNTGSCVGNLYVVVGKTDGTNFTTFFSGDVGSATDICVDGTATYSGLTIASNCNGTSNCTFDATQKYLIINFYLYITAKSSANGTAVTFNVAQAPASCTTTTCPNVATTDFLPENLWWAFLLMPVVVPMILRHLKDRNRVVHVKSKNIL